MTSKGQLTLLMVLVGVFIAVSGGPLYYHSERRTSDIQVLFHKLKTNPALAMSPAAQSSEGSGETWLRCDTCKLATKAVQFALEIGVGSSELEDIMINLCDWLDLYDQRVCTGVVHMFKAEVLYVMEHMTLNPDDVCSIFISPDCGQSHWPLPPWNVTLPTVPKPPVTPHVLPKPGSPTLRVLHLTDIHLDQLYTPGTNAQCKEPLCCRSYDGKPEPSDIGAGQYGDYRNCDTPIWTLEGLFSHLSTQQFDYILWTGDLPAHNVWNQPRAAQTGMLYNLTDLMNTYFPNKPIFPSVGNHESSPVNSFPPRYITGQQSIAWLYDAIADAWKTWLPSDALATVRKGGYYTISPYPGFRIISLNTNVCHEFNWWLLLNTTDPDGQLAWLIDILQMAENNKEKVYIIGHIPPGINNCLKYWSYNYYLIVDRYESTITGQFFGHTHFDHFEVFYDAETLTRPTNVAYITPSITPYSFLNMGYRIFTMDGNYPSSSWEILDHDTFILNLTAANLLPSPPVWELEYSAKGTYGMPSLFPADWDQLVSQAEKNNTLLQMLYRFYYKSNTEGPCDHDCGEKLLCAMRSARSYSQADFCPNIPLEDFANSPLFAQMC